MLGLKFVALLPFVFLALGSTVLPPRQDRTFPVSVTRSQNSSAGFGFAHAANDEYTATIYVNGIPFQVICISSWLVWRTRSHIPMNQVVLDTGSSDTWIDPLSIGGTVPNGLVSTGRNSTTEYVYVCQSSWTISPTLTGLQSTGTALSPQAKSYLPISALVPIPSGTRQSVGFQLCSYRRSLSNPAP